MTPEISARRPQFLPLSFLHPAIQVGQMIAQEADLVEIFSLLLRANLPEVPKIHSQIFINPKTSNVVVIHKKHNKS